MPALVLQGKNQVNKKFFFQPEMLIFAALPYFF